MSFCNLHGHTTYSFLDGMGTPAQICKRVTDLGQKYVAVTDHGNVFAHVPYMKAARKYPDLKIIFGLEGYIVPVLTDRTPVVETRGAGSFPHITLLARTQQGYSNLMKLHKLSWEEGFYYKPRIDLEMLWKHQEGLTVLSGCVGGLPLTYLRAEKLEECHKHLQLMKSNIESYYAEFVPTPGYENIPGYLLSKLAQMAYELNIPAVITSDAHFPAPEHHIIEDIMLCIGTGQKIYDNPRKIQLASYHFYGTEHELIQRAKDMYFNASDEWLRYAINNSVHIAEQCEQVEIPKAGKFTYLGLEVNETAEEKLWKLIVKGVQIRFQQGKIKQGNEEVYFERACYEYIVLKKKQFCDYILAVNDIVHNSKNKNELVMLRGSAAGCLLLWLLGASETDPIFHKLSFERFFDMNRNDPPDVDMDFEKRKRDDHINYIFNTYGEECCAQISNVQELRAKQSVVDTARVLGIPRSEYAPLSAALDSADEEVDKQIDALEDQSAKEVLMLYPQLKLAAGLVGQFRQSSIHAAGVIISPNPLGDSIGIVKQKNKRPIVSIDKKGAADLGYLKFDVLSVNAYDVVAQTLRKCGYPVSILYDLPIDDPNVYAMANAGKLAGVFQLAGGSALRVSRKIGLDTFEDLYAASALCRPGPSELVQVYADNKHNPQQFNDYMEMFHPVMQDIVKDTYGVMIYQEQVMRIARELACMEWVDVHKLRKGIQDKLGLIPVVGEVWESEWKTKFVDGCMTNHTISENEVLYIWDNIKRYGGYGFNKSHACTYGLISYWMLWLKTYLTDCFYETYLQYDTDNKTRKNLIREYTESGGKVMLFDLEKPTQHFSCVEPKRIVGGFAELKGIGDAIAYNALESGKTGMDFLEDLGSTHSRNIQDTGVLSGNWDVQRLIAIAPWFPVPMTGKREKEMNDGSFTTISYLLKNFGTAFDGNVTVMGYVTEMEVDEERIVFTIEDEGGLITARVPLKRVSELKTMFEGFRIGDYVAVEGWFSGEVLYIKHGVIALAAPDIKLENRNRKISQSIERYKVQAEKTLERWNRYRKETDPKKIAKHEDLLRSIGEKFIVYCERIKAGAGEEYFSYWLKGMGEVNPYVIANTYMGYKLLEKEEEKVTT